LILTWLATAAVLVSCGPAAASSVLAGARPSAPPSPTAFLPLEPSATPAELRLWMAPDIPETLRLTVLDAARAGAQPVRVVAAETDSTVRLVADGETPVADWVYALTAPFPTVDDAVSLDQLVANWRSTDSAALPLFVDPVTAAAMTAVLGTPGMSVVIVPEDQSLVDASWNRRPSRAVVPFEDLDVRWKVLRVGDVSPLDNDAGLPSYPLERSYGLSGDVGSIAAIEATLRAGSDIWPLTNRRRDHMTVVAMTGVTALTRATAWEMDRQGVTFPARDIGDWLRSADITHISNEVSFTPACPAPLPDQTALVFCSAPRYLDLLKDVGTDVVELTGNHELDAGTEAFLGTLDLYRQQGWPFFGGGANVTSARDPVLFEHNGNRIAFLGCNEAGPPGDWASEDRPGSTPCGADRMTGEVQALRQQGYLPIFTFQWHEHYTPVPPESQQEAFRAAAESGAVAVSGSQAHQPQGFEFRDGAFIHYGLGNLFFDQMWSNETRQEFVDRYVFYEGRLVSVELLTAYLEDWSRPRPMTPEERAAFLANMFTASGW
jgi:hypothetical protein